MAKGKLRRRNLVRGKIFWRGVYGPKALPFAQPRATPWGTKGAMFAYRPNGPTIR